MNRDDWNAIIGAIAFAALLVLSSAALADDVPCPPKQFFCWEAKWAFGKYGVSRVVAKARACGWTPEEISEALKCRK
jgi:hypothetical protein